MCFVRALYFSVLEDTEGVENQWCHFPALAPVSDAVLPVPTVGLKWTVADDCPVISSSLLGERSCYRWKISAPLTFWKSPILAWALHQGGSCHISWSRGNQPCRGWGSTAVGARDRWGTFAQNARVLQTQPCCGWKMLCRYPWEAPSSVEHSQQRAQNTDGPLVAGAAQQAQPGHPEQVKGKQTKPVATAISASSGGGRITALSRPSAWFVSEL